MRLGEQSFETKIDCREDINTKKNICADPPIDIRVEKILIHPDYHKTAMQITNDIGLLRLEKSVKYTSKNIIL